MLRRSGWAMRGTISPSKHCSIAQLEKIQSDNYLGADCKHDYQADDLDELLWRKRQKKADEIDFDFNSPELEPKTRVIKQYVVMPPLPKIHVETWVDRVMRCPINL